MPTFPRNSCHGKVLRSVQIGAQSKSPASILATKFAQAKLSISLKAIVRRVGIARLSPRSMPPYPAQSEMCVIVLVVSTFLLVGSPAIFGKKQSVRNSVRDFDPRKHLLCLGLCDIFIAFGEAAEGFLPRLGPDALKRNACCG